MNQFDARLVALIRAIALARKLRLVPAEPLPEQCIAGSRAGRVAPEVARNVYCAMVDADDRD